VLAATVLGGFPFADVPFAGVATIVVTEDDPVLARRYADELAAICWAQRDDFTIRPTAIGRGHH
jgi:microcystin degradation protein MlrC